MPQEKLNEQKTRILLKLWGQEDRTAKQGELTGDLARKAKGETSADYKLGLDELCEMGAVAHKARAYLLTAAGEAELGEALRNPDFKFDTNAGARMVNALLKWIREKGGDVALVKASPAIASYEEFKKITLETYERLNRDYNMGNLVPIYRIRREIGEQVSRNQFSEWLFEMQSDDFFELMEESVEDSAPDKIEDSVSTKFGKLRCYAKLLTAK